MNKKHGTVGGIIGSMQYDSIRIEPIINMLVGGLISTSSLSLVYDIKSLEWLFFTAMMWGCILTLILFRKKKENDNKKLLENAKNTVG